MARINFEDSIWKDVRFCELQIKLQNIDKAIGCLVRAWVVAQKWYLTNEKTIPLEEWKKQRLPDELFEVGLAELKDNGVWICGADQQFNWLKQKSEAGRKGGKKNNKKDKKNNNLKDQLKRGEAGRSGEKHMLNEEKRTLNEEKPLSLSLSLNKKEEEDMSSSINLFELWNENCLQLPKANLFTAKRIKKANSLVRKIPDKSYWEGIIKKIANNKFCNGGGSTGWRADFDFLLKSDTHVKVSEGKYENFEKQKVEHPFEMELKK